MDLLAPFLAASGLQLNTADSTAAAASHQPLPDLIASARTSFPHIAIAIDDPSTTDVDDAISYEAPLTPAAPCTVHIHIADVDRWLSSASSPLFQLLEQRTSSAYFPGLHIPLLPQPLCLLSSLLPVSRAHASSPPHQPNPCISISIKIHSDGSISDITVCPYYLPKLVRLTYDVVDCAIGTSHSCPSFREHWQQQPPPLAPLPTDPRDGFTYDSDYLATFRQLQERSSPGDSRLTQELRQALVSLSSVAACLRRRRRGGMKGEVDEDVDFYSEFHAAAAPSSPSSESLDLCGRMSSAAAPSPSPSPSPSATAATASSTPPAQLNARFTVAEFMIAACAASASWCRTRNIPVHYRSQSPPNLELSQLQLHSSRAFAATAKASLSSLDFPSVVPGVEFMSLFASKMTTISGMHGAVTNIHPQRHHGIGADAYTQSTSPIRRFSDLLVQRQMKAALGFGDAVAADRVQASLARQNAVRGWIKRTERVLERRAILNILRARSVSVDDPSKLLYHCVVLKSLPPGKGTPGYFGDFPTDTALLPPHAMAHVLGPLSLVSPVRCASFMILIPALGALERCLLPVGTLPGTCFTAVAVSGNAVYGRIRFVKVA